MVQNRQRVMHTTTPRGDQLEGNHYLQSSPKRRRLTPPSTPPGVSSLNNDVDPQSDPLPRNDSLPIFVSGQDVCQDDQKTISISASSKQAGQTVAPFLTKHIPDQYAPGAGWDSTGNKKVKDPNTKYCYRPRRDLKCRRQVDEPSMDQLQHELEDLPAGDQQAIAHVWSLFSAAPAKQRNLMLQGILTQCCFPQLSYLAASVRELIRIDFLTALPPECSFNILSSLDTKSLCRAAQVSQKWRSLADDDVIWHKMCEQHIAKKCDKCGWGLPLLEKKRLRASKRQIQLRATGKGLNEWSPNITPLPEEFSGPSKKTLQDDQLGRQLTINSTAGGRRHPESDDSYFKPLTRPWKDVYKDRFQVGINWKHGRCSIKSFKGHTVCTFPSWSSARILHFWLQESCLTVATFSA